MRDGFVFYRSFDVALANLSDSDRLKALRMLCDYALDGKEPQEKGVARAVFECFRPQIDANNRRYENGSKGGRPKKTEKKPKETKAKPKDNQEEPELDKEHYGENGHVLLTVEEYQRLCGKYGINKTEQAIKVLDDYIDGLEPAKKKAYLKKNHCRCMQNWCYDRVTENELKSRKQTAGTSDEFFQRVLGGAV